MHDGSTPFFAAASSGHLEVVRYFCSEGACFDRPRHDGASPLYIAALRGHLAVSQHLCIAKADLHRSRGLDGKSPVCAAAAEGHVEVVRLLCEARADKEKTMHDGSNALSLASRIGHTGVVEYLRAS